MGEQLAAKMLSLIASHHHANATAPDEHPHSSAPSLRTGPWHPVLLKRSCWLVVLVALAVFSTTLREFVSWDDDTISSQSTFKIGPFCRGLRWMFFRRQYSPLPCLGMVDLAINCQMDGLNPSAFHLQFTFPSQQTPRSFSCSSIACSPTQVPVAGREPVAALFLSVRSFALAIIQGDRGVAGLGRALSAKAYSSPDFCPTYSTRTAPKPPGRKRSSWICLRISLAPCSLHPWPGIPRLVVFEFGCERLPTPSSPRRGALCGLEKIRFCWCSFRAGSHDDWTAHSPAMAPSRWQPFPPPSSDAGYVPLEAGIRSPLTLYPLSFRYPCPSLPANALLVLASRCFVLSDRDFPACSLSGLLPGTPFPIFG